MSTAVTCSLHKTSKQKLLTKQPALKNTLELIYTQKRTCEGQSSSLAQFLHSTLYPHLTAAYRRTPGSHGSPLLLVLFLLPALAAGHQHASTYGSSALSEWRSAKASYYAADPEDAIGGACGFGDLGKHGYGMATVGLSTALFERGAACGGCYEVKCVENLRYCLPGTSIVVTATNFCAPNYGLPADAGGVCNPPNHHFLLPIQAFEKIALWKAGVMPIQYRRVKCLREGGVRFSVSGRSFFLTVLISNVGGAGDVRSVKIKGTESGWFSMGRNWGQIWHINADFQGQPLSFELTSSDGTTLTSFNVAPKEWNWGKTYTGKQFLL